MRYNKNDFHPKAVHKFSVKDDLIEIRRKEWRTKEKKRRRIIFAFRLPSG